MNASETGKLTTIPSRKEEINAQLSAIAQKQKNLAQQIRDRHAEGRPRLAILDDQFDELEAKREQLAREPADSRGTG